MIRGVGIDVVDIQRMAAKIGKSGFTQVAFTESEIAYCEPKKHSAQHYAARFAAKEAYMKAIGKGWSNEADFKEIELAKNEEGKPEIILKGRTLSYFRESDYKEIHVSFSHTENTATAIVILTA